MEFITQYWDTVVAGLLAAHALALFIVNITPTPVDNVIVEKLYRFIEIAAGIVHKDNIKS